MEIMLPHLPISLQLELQSNWEQALNVPTPVTILTRH